MIQPVIRHLQESGRGLWLPRRKLHLQPLPTVCLQIRLRQYWQPCSRRGNRQVSISFACSFPTSHSKIAISPACVEGLSFRFTPLLSHSVAARPDFWGQPRRATVLASGCSVGKDRMLHYISFVNSFATYFYKKIGHQIMPMA